MEEYLFQKRPFPVKHPVYLETYLAAGDGNECYSSVEIRVCIMCMLVT